MNGISLKRPWNFVTTIKGPKGVGPFSARTTFGGPQSAGEIAKVKVPLHGIANA
jgi:hypothetical protein